MTYTPPPNHLKPAFLRPSLPEPTSISQLNFLPNPLEPKSTFHQSFSRPPIAETPSRRYAVPQTDWTRKLASTFPIPGQLGPACALCNTSLAPSTERFSFPSTAPAALAALETSVTLSTPSRLFCHACWVRIHDLSICWACGETVTRGEERIGYGWCWWHWGCVGCLFCRVWPFLLLRALAVSRTRRRGVCVDRIVPLGTAQTTTLDKQPSRHSPHPSTHLQVLHLRSRFHHNLPFITIVVDSNHHPISSSSSSFKRTNTTSPPIAEMDVHTPVQSAQTCSPCCANDTVFKARHEDAPQIFLFALGLIDSTTNVTREGNPPWVSRQLAIVNSAIRFA